MKRLLLASILLTPLAASAQTPDARPVVARAARVYRELSSLQADFVQTIADRSQGDTLTSRGTIIQAGNNYFAMRFTDPPGEAIVIDGKYIWTYTPSTAPNQVYRIPISTDPVYGQNLILALLDRPADRYETSYLRREEVNGRPADVIAFVPTSNAAQFRRATLWLDVNDALPRRVELEQAPGVRQTLVLSRLVPNAPYTKKTFTFDVPPGVRIIDGL